MSAGQQLDRDFAEVEDWARRLRLALEAWGLDLEATLEDWSTTVELSGAAANAVARHVELADPHPGYLTQAEGDGLYATAGHTHPRDSALNRLNVLTVMSGGI